jgi:hypothetical protein
VDAILRLASLMKIIVLLLLSFLIPVRAQSESNETWKLYKYQRAVAEDGENDYAVSLFTSTDVAKVEVSTESKKHVLWTSEADGNPTRANVIPSPSGAFLAILTPHPTQTPSDLLVFRRKSGLDFGRVHQKKLQRKFDELLGVAASEHGAERYGISLGGWFIDEENADYTEELVIEFRAVTSPQEERRVVGARTLLFNPATGVFRDKE